MRRKRVLITFFASLVTILLFAIYCLFFYFNELDKLFVKSNLTTLQESLNIANNNIVQEANDTYQKAKLFTDCLKVQLVSSDGSISNYTFSRIEKYQEIYEFDHVAIVNMNSEKIYSSKGEEINISSSLMGSSSYKDGFSSEIITSPFIESSNRYLIYRMKFVGTNGISYMIIMQKSMDTINTVISMNTINEVCSIIIIRDNGDISYQEGNKLPENTNLFKHLEKENSEELNKFKCNVSNEISGTITLEFNNKKYYYLYEKIAMTDWTSVIEISEEALRGDLLADINYLGYGITLSLTGLGAVVITVIMAFIIHMLKRKEYQIALEKNQLFIEMSKHVPTIFAIFESISKKPIFVSSRMHEYYEKEIERVDDSFFSEWGISESFDSLVQRVKKEDFYSLIATKDEKYFTVGLCYLGLIKGDEHYALVVEDITKEHIQNEILKNSMNAAENANQLKTNFLAKMSHEMRTPLNAILGFTRLAINNIESLEKKDLLHYLRNVDNSSKYLLELLSDILDINKIEVGKIQLNLVDYNLRKLIDEVASSFTGQMESKGIKFILDYNFDKAFVMIDVSSLKQVLYNIISNAYKFTNSYGTIILESKIMMQDENKTSVIFKVTDSGNGMSADFINKIFVPFEQERNNRGSDYKGTGLGMAICKSIVDLYDGTITVDSKPLLGTIVTVNITFTTAAEIEERKKEEVNDYSLLKGMKILVVEDNDLNRELIGDFLAEYGVIIDEAKNGLEGVEKFVKSKINEYDAIFMDIQMPYMDGYDATKEIRKQNRADAKEVQIIAMTADAFTTSVNMALGCGMNNHFTKPIEIDKIINYLILLAKEKNDVN